MMLQRVQTWSMVRLLCPMSWRRFVVLFLGIFAGGIALLYVFVLLVDPYDLVPFSLPIERPIVSIAQRFTYPQIVRSRRFDSFIVGSSTARLIDPQALNGSFQAHFANLSMDAMTPWEQMEMADYFLRKAGAPKILIVALDGRWCDQAADRVLTQHGFPVWMYDDNPWNDYLHLLNSGTLEIAARLVGYQFGLYRERIRDDGYQVFVPPESKYDLSKAQHYLWGSRAPQIPPALPPPALSERERQSLSFPALLWLDRTLAKLPPATLKIVADMPVHITTQPWPGTHAAAVERECKARVAAIARQYAVKVIDWRIVSPLTSKDSNYWDPLHYRLPIAERIARGLIAAVLKGRESADGSYRIVVP
jgi:hypothetical protein